MQIPQELHGTPTSLSGVMSFIEAYFVRNCLFDLRAYRIALPAEAQDERHDIASRLSRFKIVHCSQIRFRSRLKSHHFGRTCNPRWSDQTVLLFFHNRDVQIRVARASACGD